MKLKKIRQFPFKGIVAVMMTMITGNWASGAIQGEAPFYNMFGPFPTPYKEIVIALTIVLFVLFFLMLYQYRLSFFPIKSLSRDEVTPHKCLIIPVSTPYPLNRENDVLINKNEDGGYSISIKKLGKEEWIDVPGDGIDEDIKRLAGTGWSWQQMLRCIKPHKDRLKHIYLIGSPDGNGKKGSYEVLCAAEFFINHYLKNIKDPKLHKHPESIDFEDFDSLTAAFDKAIAEFKEIGITEKDIIIDITGGQKPVSIAGAVITLNKNVTFQYVQTIPDKSGKYKVWAYDVIIQPPTV